MTRQYAAIFRDAGQEACAAQDEGRDRAALALAHVSLLRAGCDG
jgi:hypothetical protein